MHQLGLAHFVYPSARHTRFEHSLGVMHLAERIFDTITDPDNIREEVREKFGDDLKGESRGYWRNVVKLAALCHDMGHLPFSHSAEEILSEGENHETISRKLIESNYIKEILNRYAPPVQSEIVVKLALGPKELKTRFTAWEELLAEIVTGDAFGADRIDYLLRDSYHIGVPYGHFDHIRLIDSLRILPYPAADDLSVSKDSIKFGLGVDEGGLRTVEGLLLARYHMYNQVYFHPIVKAYELHLIDFMKKMFEVKKLSDIDTFLEYSDGDVYSEICRARYNTKHPGHYFASLILNRNHFKPLYIRNKNEDPNAIDILQGMMESEFSKDKFRVFDRKPKRKGFDFPILCDQTIKYATDASDLLAIIPPAGFQCIYIEASLLGKAKSWLVNNKEKLLEKSLDENKDVGEVKE